LFFGSWCPWCTAFDAYVTQTYLNVKEVNGDDTEIVYMSVDSDEAMYLGKVSEKPWVSVPFNRAQGIGEAPVSFIRKKVREATGKPQGTMASHFGVASVPTMIVLNGQTGKITNEKFMDERNPDVAAAGHEWNAKAPSSWLEVAPEPMANPWIKLLGPTLMTAVGEKPTAETLANKKHVALVFAGNWCPWCRALEPYLLDTYGKLKGKNADDTEIVYLSVDDDEAAYITKTATHPFPSMPYNRAQGIGEEALGFIRKRVRQERAAAEGNPALANKQGALASRFKVDALPTIVVCDGKTAVNLYEDFITEKGKEPADGHEWTVGKAPPSWLDAAKP